MINWIKSLVKKTTINAVETPQHLKFKEMDEDTPRYPPFMKGLPPKNPELLLKTQYELINKIKNESKTSEEIFNIHYMGPIQRFVEFVHLLPASQSHHHRGAGGLLRHSLEVGLWCLRTADSIILPDVLQEPWRKRKIEPRWLLTAFLAGLFHDVGKPVTDLSIRNFTDTSRWNPNTDTLWAWIARERIDAYFLEWQTGRAKQHVAITGVIASDLISKKTLGWISDEHRKLMVWLLETFNGTPASNNPLSDILTKNDQASVEFDLKSMGAPMAGYDLGVPVERTIIDIMRSFVRSEVWGVNKDGARVWCIENAVYLVWPVSGQDIAREVINRDVPGVPRNSDSILDMLMERNLADAGENGDLYIVAPDILTEKNPKINLKCIKLKDDSLVSSEPIANAKGKILTKKETEDIKRNTPTKEEGSGIKETEDGAVKSIQSESQTLVDEDFKNPQNTINQGEVFVDPETGEIFPVNNIANSFSIIDDISTGSEKAPLNDPGLEKQGKSQIKPSDSVASKHKEKKEIQSVKLTGLAGEALKALAHDLSNRVKDFDSNALVREDGKVMLFWPVAFQGYGLTIAALIEDLNSKKWFYVKSEFDPKVSEYNGAKVICLIDEVSQEFLKLANFKNKEAKENKNSIALMDEDNKIKDLKKEFNRKRKKSTPVFSKKPDAVDLTPKQVTCDISSAEEEKNKKDLKVVIDVISKNIDPLEKELEIFIKAVGQLSKSDRDDYKTVVLSSLTRLMENDFGIDGPREMVMRLSKQVDGIKVERSLVFAHTRLFDKS